MDFEKLLAKQSYRNIKIPVLAKNLTTCNFTSKFFEQKVRIYSEISAFNILLIKKPIILTQISFDFFLRIWRRHYLMIL